MPRERDDSDSDAGPTREDPRPGESVLTLVCETCGKDYFFDEEQPPEGLRCEKCGSTVFRSFMDRAGDEAAEDFRDTTERDLDPDDAEGDVLPGDVLDLDNA